MDWDAVRRGDVAAVERCLLSGGASVNAVQLRTDGDRTALHTAALHGHEPLVAILLRYRADPTLRADCRAGRIAPPVAEGSVRLRPRLGGESRPTSDVQRASTPLELATRAGHTRVATLLRIASGLPPARTADRDRESRARAALEAEADEVARAAQPRELDVRNERVDMGAIASARPTPWPGGDPKPLAHAQSETQRTPAAGKPAPAAPEATAAPAAAPEPIAAGVPIAREARPKLAHLLNPTALPSWQPHSHTAGRDGGSGADRYDFRDADTLALFDGLRLKPAIAAAQRIDTTTLQRERRAAEREPYRLREEAEARFTAGNGGRVHISYETGARELQTDVLVTRATAPVGGVRERAVDRWR